MVSFELLVEVVHQTHKQMAHIGAEKLSKIVSQHFWHPALNRVANDVARACLHCQVFKVTPQMIRPPIKKINTNYPFELVSIDLMNMPKTSKQNCAVMVAVDHDTKWLAAYPMKNKKAETVVKIMKDLLLPSLPRLPDQILTDNGPEFKAEMFNKLLENFSIKHIFSTPYHASSNGAVERTNRTTLNLIKGILPETEQWDEALSKAVIVYNNTVHTNTEQSPSSKILSLAHDKPDKLLVDSKTVETWKPGNPKFAPYNIGDKVLKKIVKMGNKVENKITPIYEGLFIIEKVHPNDLTYVMKRIGSENGGKEHRAHRSSCIP